MRRTRISGATAWLVRRHSGRWDARQERELTAWLAADPSNRRDFQALQSLWGELDLLTATWTPDASAASRRKRAPLRRAVHLLAACGAALLIIGAPLRSERDPTSSVHRSSFATTTGQRLDTSLPDGSTLSLNVDSGAVVAYFSDRREVSIARGEAFFDVRPDPARPFNVRARDVTIRAVGTQFNIYLAPRDVRVTVREGRVEVTTTGQRLALDPGDGVHVSETATRYTVQAADVAAWRSGQVVFRDESLSEILLEVGRYHPAPILLADPSLHEHRLSGVLRLDDPSGFLVALPHVLPVRVHREPDGAVTIVSKR